MLRYGACGVGQRSKIERKAGSQSNVSRTEERVGGVRGEGCSDLQENDSPGERKSKRETRKRESRRNQERKRGRCKTAWGK